MGNPLLEACRAAEGLVVDCIVPGRAARGGKAPPSGVLGDSGVFAEAVGGRASGCVYGGRLDDESYAGVRCFSWEQIALYGPQRAIERTV